MKNVYVETSNVRRYLAAMDALAERGASEACMVVVYGEPGLGKTTTLRNWVAQTGSVYLRAKKEWTAAWFLEELLESMRIAAPRAFKDKYRAAIGELAVLQGAASRDRGTFSLVIDEADHISPKQSILDTVRDLTDNAEFPAVLVGMAKINDNLRRFPQVSSRVSQRVLFERASKADIRLLINSRCEVKVADDLVEFVLKVSGGYNREVLEAIANIERFGLRADVDSEGVRLADMAGQIILNDRASSKPVMVPRVI